MKGREEGREREETVEGELETNIINVVAAGNTDERMSERTVSVSTQSTAIALIPGLLPMRCRPCRQWKLEALVMTTASAVKDNDELTK